MSTNYTNSCSGTCADCDCNHTALHEECGVFGISVTSGDVVNPAYETYTALFALQHRGQQACGIAVNDRGVISLQKDLGLLVDVFDEKTLLSMKGNMAVGHVRYSAREGNTRENAQPLVTSHVKGNLAVAHNGSLTNAGILRDELEMSGSIFQTNSDSEVISYLIVRERLKRATIEDSIKGAMSHLRGAYSLVIMSPRKLIAVRDPNGFRPLCIGRLDNSYVFASETCALDTIGATFIRDVHPGEICVVEDGELRSIDSGIHSTGGLCVFEYVYFARPDSVIDGLSVNIARQQMGAYLAKEHPVDADVVIGVPDSGLSAALGYSRASGIPYSVGLIKNRYIARTFIQPTQNQRERAVRIKLNCLASAVRGKRVVMVDDSIVRGTTSEYIVALLREAGAAEVHMRLSSPPFLHPCYFGTDVPDRDMLIACKYSLEEIRRKINVDSLGYLSIDALREMGKTHPTGFCLGCFSGEYPVDIKDDELNRKNQFERRIGQ